MGPMTAPRKLRTSPESATGAVLGRTTSRDVAGPRCQTALCPSCRVLCAPDRATSRARVLKITAKVCVQTEGRVNCVEKRRTSQRTAPCAKKLMEAPLLLFWVRVARLELTRTTST